MPLAIILCACIHEFSWRMFPHDIQGQWWAMTQWLPIASLGAAAFCERTRALKAAAVVAIVMSATTSLCSAYWLAIDEFETQPGQVQCSSIIGFPLELLSVLAALVVLRRK